MNPKLQRIPVALAGGIGVFLVALDLCAQNAPPGGGPGGPGPGGFGGMMQQKTELVEKFDKDGDKRLDVAERKAAREFLQKERKEGRGPGGPFGGGGGGGGGPFGPGREANREPPHAGAKLSPADVKSFADAPLYDPQTLRTFFLEFEDADWEKELAEFKNTDVEVPAKLTVDGKTYADVGVHFRGMSSFGMVGEGSKRSLNLSLDFAHKDQQLGGYRTFNLLNSHEDPTFLRAVLFYQVAREYVPAPRANFVRVVINGESWGVYANAQQFNKDFLKEWFGTTRGARWKVPGSPGGRGSLAYLGDDPAKYKRIYELKTKDDPKVWADFIQLCKVLNQTPPDKLEEALAPLLDVDGALRFLALENALINNDGYWIRTSDYSIYQDEKGRFHIIPSDGNETFTRPGGPDGGPGGGFGFGRGALAQLMLTQADKNGDRKVTKAELAALADVWFDKLDLDKSGKLSQEQFPERVNVVLSPQPGSNPPGGAPPQGGGPGAGPGASMGPTLFKAVDADKNGSLTRAELKETFEKWSDAWDAEKSGALNEQQLAAGLRATLPRADFAGPGGGGPGGGGPGFRNATAVNGVELDPLVAANDANKPLVSKLLAVPALRAKYLGYVRDVAEKWLDWKKLGAIAERYHALIAEDVKADTRKLDSTEDFDKGLTENIQGGGGFGPRETISLKNFAEQRRAYLFRYLGRPDVVGGSNLKVAKDFKLELLYTVPKETEGSWVAMCLDPKGRLIVSDQNGPLYRVTVPQPQAGGGAVRTERIDLDVGGAHGLLYAFDSLYVMVNEGKRPHGIYRVRDSDGDDKLDKVELLRPMPGGGEHGLHALVLAPDGKSIYVACGNQTGYMEMDASRVPLNWSEDDLLRRLPTGFMDDSLAPQGYVARVDPDGKKWELIAMGMRNEFDIAFNSAGELFTYDADMEWDIGEPWYRPTRVNHVISGAEFGFRNGNGKWPEYYIDSFGKAVDIGPGSPTGITFGYGAKFPAKYQDALYLADWSFGKLRAAHLTPDGASYTGEMEEFVSGQPLPVTDVLINPQDGAMYFAVGGRGAQSALYRVTYTGTESTAPSQPDSRLQALRDLRHKLESFHGHKDAAAVETVWPFLGDQDRALRFAARIALEWQDPSEWREKALAEKDARKAIAALVALARVSGKDKVHRKQTDPAALPGLRGRMLSALDELSWSHLENGDRIDLLRAYSLVFIRLGRPDDATCQRLIAKFDASFPAKNRALDALLAQLLAYLEAPSAASKILAALRNALTQEEQIDYAVALGGLKVGWTMPLREEYFRWFVTKAATYRGGNTFASSLRTLKAQAIETLSDDEKAALKPILEAAPEQKSPQQILAARKLVKEWTLSELVPAAERGLNGGRNFERGRRLYSEVACVACHRFNQDGGSVAPDLTGVAGRYNVRDLLESIVEPSKVISDQYSAIVIHKTDGQIVTGRVGNLGGSSMSVIENMLDPGAMTDVRRQDIESMEMSNVSVMPEGLLNSLREDEILDLIAYLLSRGDSSSPLFR